jgi:hypothetical protein
MPSTPSQQIAEGKHSEMGKVVERAPEFHSGKSVGRPERALAMPIRTRSVLAGSEMAAVDGKHTPTLARVKYAVCVLAVSY